MQLPGAQFLCRAAESEARCGPGNLEPGFSGHPPPPPLLPSHPSGRLPSVELGFRPRGGTSRFGQRSLPPHLPLGERGAQSWDHGRGHAQHSPLAVSALGHYAPRTELPPGGRQPWITPCFLSVPPAPLFPVVLLSRPIASRGGRTSKPGPLTHPAPLQPGGRPSGSVLCRFGPGSNDMTTIMTNVTVYTSNMYTHANVS